VEIQKTEEGVYVYCPPQLITAIATLVSLFTVLASFINRKEPSINQRSAWRSFLIGAASLVLYLLGYFVSLHAYSLMGIESDDPRRLTLEVPLLLLYSVFSPL